MRVIQFLVLLFLVSCSSVKEEKTAEEQEMQQPTYFEIIFEKSGFNNFELGDFSESLYQENALLHGDYYSYSVDTENGETSAIKLDISVQEAEKAKKLIKDIVEHYNQQFEYTKKPSNFVTWSYTVEKNVPAQVSLIYEKELKTVSLEIGYMVQR